jgi:hypothetical protein
MFVIKILVPKSSFLQFYISKCLEFLEEKMIHFSTKNQAFIGAFIVSSASIPVFLIIMIFNIHSLVLLNSMSAFAAGGLVGDVLLHNLPEIYQKNQNCHDSEVNFFESKITLLGIGLISLFAIEKMIKILYKKTTKVCDQSIKFNLLLFLKLINEDMDITNIFIIVYKRLNFDYRRK